MTDSKNKEERQQQLTFHVVVDIRVYQIHQLYLLFQQWSRLLQNENAKLINWKARGEGRVGSPYIFLTPCLSTKPVLLENQRQVRLGDSSLFEMHTWYSQLSPFCKQIIKKTLCKGFSVPDPLSLLNSVDDRERRQKFSWWDACDDQTNT